LGGLRLAAIEKVGNRFSKTAMSYSPAGSSVGAAGSVVGASGLYSGGGRNVRFCRWAA
jgi:hypothetical protein